MSRLNEMVAELFDVSVADRQLLRELGVNNLPMNAMRTDIVEAEDKYVIKMDLPGFKKEDLKITLENGYLTISAEKTTENEDVTVNYIRRERYSGRQERRFRVNENVTLEDISAAFKHGVLTVDVLKKEPIEKEKPTVEIK